MHPCRELGMLRPQPVPRGDKAGERLRQFGEQRLAHCYRQIVSRQKIFADRRQMAEALDDAVERKRRHVERRDFPEARDRLAPHRLRRWPRQVARGRKRRPAMATCASVAPVAIRSTRSSSSSSGECARIGSATSGWSSPSACTTTCGASSADANTSASARRTSGEASSSNMIIAPSAAAQIVSRQIGVKIGARQRRSGFRPLAGRRLAHPLQELTNNHWHDRRDVTATHLTAASGYRTSLNKAFTIEIDRLLSISGARR